MKKETQFMKISERKIILKAPELYDLWTSLSIKNLEYNIKLVLQSLIFCHSPSKIELEGECPQDFRKLVEMIIENLLMVKKC